VTFAAASVGRRKIRSGSSGAFDRSSMTTKAATRANDAASRAIVVGVPQPSVVARVSA
jgi:hypothetical protein